MIKPNKDLQFNDQNLHQMKYAAECGMSIDF